MIKLFHLPDVVLAGTYVCGRRLCIRL